jgi:hypothetical protein
MVLDSLRKNEIDITQLSLEPAEYSEAAFNPENYITDADWGEMVKILEERKGSKSWPEVLIVLSDLKIISPTRAESLELSQATRDEILSSITLLKSSLRSVPASHTWANLVKDQGRFAILYPELRSELNLEEVTQDNIRKDIASNFSLGWLGSIKSLAYCRILCPDIDLDSILEDWMKEEATREYQWLLNRRPLENPFLEYASNAKLAFPDWEEFKLDPKLWTELLQSWQMVESLEAPHKAQCLLADGPALKILAAERVDIDDKGLHITMPAKMSEIKPAENMPDQRNF